MKKVVLASLLAVASAASLTAVNFAQAPTPNLGTAPAGGQIQMSADEYAAYNNAITQTTPVGKAAAFEAYLKAYPNSAVKADVLQQTMFAYSQVPDTAKTLDTADRLLAVEPNNLYAYVFEVQLRRAAADAATDPAAKQADYDAAASYATKGLAATKSKDMSDADFTKLTSQGYPVFYSAIGTDDLQKKDTAGANKAFTSELNAVPVATTTTPGLQLQDTYYLAQAYYASVPPNYVDCAYYAARAMSYAPEPYKTQFQKLANYCYVKYHGRPDGFDAFADIAKSNLTPPAICPPPPPAGSTAPATPAPAGCLPITPAPKPEDIVTNLIATTPDLATLAISDKEFVLQYGKPADADKVFDTIKAKSVELPGVTVISATPDVLTVAVSDDAVQSKTADFTFNMKEPIKEADVPAVGALVTLDGTYASYTQKPLMITMSDGALVLPKKATPVRHIHHTTH